jgi:hypothetical protein
MIGCKSVPPRGYKSPPTGHPPKNMGNDKGVSPGILRIRNPEAYATGLACTVLFDSLFKLFDAFST